MLKHLSCSNFRNLTELVLELNPGLNIIYGNNGAGKTSVLEAIYYLFHGKSFRSNNKESMIKFEAPTFALFARLNYNNEAVTIGVSKLRQGNNTIKYNGEKIKNVSQVAHIMPVKFIPSIPQTLLSDGPKARRAFLDWGLFHVKHEFHQLWQSYSKALVNRNSLLKLKLVNDELEYWDEAIIKYGELIHSYRLEHLGDIVNLFSGDTYAFVDIAKGISFEYIPGWDESLGLAKALEQNKRKDLALGYTSVGVHRSDLEVSFNKAPAADTLSAGQLKLLAYRLHLVQGVVLQQKLSKEPLYLIDDLGAELDEDNILAVISMLKDIGSQHVISYLDKVSAVHDGDSTMFHLEHGAVLGDIVAV